MNNALKGEVSSETKHLIILCFIVCARGQSVEAPKPTNRGVINYAKWLSGGEKSEANSTIGVRKDFQRAVQKREPKMVDLINFYTLSSVGRSGD